LYQTASYYAFPKQRSPKSQIPTKGSTLYVLARHSSHKVGTTSSPEGKDFRVEENVLVYVNGRDLLVELLYQRHFVLLLDEALRALGVITTVPL